MPINKKKSTCASRKQPNEFKSVLSQPFPLQTAIECVVEDYSPAWSFSQTNKIATNLIQFLELKVLVEDYCPEKQLLTPTNLIGGAWCALVRKQALYQAVTTAIQDFHARPHCPIRLSEMPPRDNGMAYIECWQQVERTQTLMTCYYPNVMVESMSQLEESIEEDDAVSFSQYSALTNASSVNVSSQLFSVLWKRTLCSKLDATTDFFDAACGKVETVNDSLSITMTESEEFKTTVPLQKESKSKSTFKKKWESFKSTVGFVRA